MAQTAQLRRIEVAENEAQRVFALQRAAYLRHPYPSYEERRANLDKLERLLVDNADAIAEAINADFGHRAFEETMIAAYNGQAANLTKQTLDMAAKIVSVEARHAGWIRAIAGKNPAPNATDKPKTATQVQSVVNSTGFLQAS